MGEPNLKERLRGFVGTIGWKMFIWAVWKGNDAAYREAVYQQEKRFKEK